MIAPCFGAPAVGDAVTQAGEARRRRRTTCLRGWRDSICRDTGIPRTLAPTTNVSRGSPRVPNAHPVETAPRDVMHRRPTRRRWGREIPVFHKAKGLGEVYFLLMRDDAL